MVELKRRTSASDVDMSRSYHRELKRATPNQKHKNKKIRVKVNAKMKKHVRMKKKSADFSPSATTRSGQQRSKKSQGMIDALVREALRVTKGDISFGTTIAIQSFQRKYLRAKSNSAAFSAKSSAITPECLFVLENPERKEDTSAVHFNEFVSLRTSDGCYVGVEANGDAHSNRTGPIGLLMKWKFISASNRKSKAIVKHKTLMFIESALHNLLKLQKNGTVVADTKDIGRISKWRILFQKAPVLNTSAWTTSDTGHARTRSGKELVQILRKGYRLAVLKMQKAEVQDLKKQIQKRRQNRKSKLSQEHLCVVCWDAPPNTVNNTLSLYL